ncbi:MAG: serine protease [Candidatus Neomarinimicrobiota bacterium]
MLIFLSSCARNIYEVTYPTLGDGKYDSEFPYRSSSRQLEEIAATVKMINVIGFYKSFVFDQALGLTDDRIDRTTLPSQASEIIHYNSTASGTATVIQFRNNRIALITCAHVVSLPDTLVNYYDDNKTIIQSIAIKDRQINYINDLPGDGDIEILFVDKKLDMAIVGKKLTSTPVPPIPVFNYPFGRARELEWGSFVYLFGYPVGNKMITKGIVSSPHLDNDRGFLIDAPFNRGSSGGIVLAIRDGIPNFELVGLASSVSANIDYVLAPGKTTDADKIDTHLPYHGEIFLRQQETIRYGITHIIAIEAIVKSLRANRHNFQAQGYDFSDLFD